MELVYDGKTISLNGKNLKIYTQIPMAGTLQQVRDKLESKGVETPAGDLFLGDAYDAITEDATDIQHVASAYIDGTECEFITVRKPDVDVQVWIQSGRAPNSATLCDHDQKPAAGAAVHDRDQQLEERNCRHPRVRLRVQADRRSEQGRSRADW